MKKDTPFKQWLFHTAFKLKLAALKAGSPWDKASGGAAVLMPLLLGWCSRQRCCRDGP